MRRLVYRRAAIRDLASISDYIDEMSGNIDTGAKVTSRLRNHCKKLAASPIVLGRARPELAEGLRSVPHESYLIFFAVQPDRVTIVNIIHAARDTEALFGKKTTT